MTSFTASGARRTGDEYQDLQSAEVLIHWLEHPELYEWVHLETSDGSLDDIQARRVDGTLRVLQVKFGTDETDAWDWDDFLKQEAGKKGRAPSLLQKWKRSLEAIQARGDVVSEAALYTNRPASAAIAAHLTGEGRIDFGALSKDLQDRLTAQLGGDAAARGFFASFQLRFHERSPEALADSLRHRFRSLGGSEQGWANLLEKIGRWINRNNEPNPDGRIQLEDVRAAALWRVPPQIPQGFLVPGDYVEPLAWSERLVEPLLEPSERGLVVVTGMPGAGKSTYLSWLTARLRAQGRPVVRHHYFLSTTDPTPGRSSWETAADSIIGQLRVSYPELIRGVAQENPLPGKVREYLTAAGRARAGASPLVLIVDGLDHVWRDTNSDEQLQRFFDLLLPAPEGVVVLVGTQDLDVARLPRKLRDACPRKEWRSVPLLDLDGVLRWLHHHASELGLASSEDGSSDLAADLAAAFHEVTRGHPLILHYTLGQLRTAGHPVRAEQVLALPRFAPGTTIADYYQALVGSLPVEGHYLLHLLAGFLWAWPRDGLVRCLAAGEDAARLAAAERAVHHLLGRTHAGVTAFHESLLAFMRSRPEHGAAVSSLRPRVLAWLAHGAPAYWRWRHEWAERRRGGDGAALIDGPTLDWCVGSLASGRARAEVARVVAESGRAAVDDGRLAAATQRSYLDNALHEASGAGGVLGRLLLLGAHARPATEGELELSVLAAQLAEQTDDELEAIAEVAVIRQRIDFCAEIAAECERRWNAPLTRAAPVRPSSSLETSMPFVLAASLRPGGERWIQRVLDEQGGYPTWCTPARYARALGRLCVLADDSAVHRDELKFLANHPAHAVLEAADQIVRLACHDGFDPGPWLSSPAGSGAELLRCYALVVRPGSASPEAPPRLRSFAPAWSTPLGDEAVFIELARAYFFSCCAFAGEGRTPPEPRDVDERAALVAQLLAGLSEIAREVADQWRTGAPIGGAWFLARVSTGGLPVAGHRDLEDRFAREAVVSRLIVAIALDLEDLLQAARSTGSLDRAAIEASVAGRWTSAMDWIAHCVERRRPLRDPAAAERLVEVARKTLEDELGDLPSRAEAFALLGHFSHLQGRASGEVSALATAAARHLFGHGYHKDIVLFDYLDAVASTKALDADALATCVRAASPIIQVIREITDGDETRHLKRELGSLLARRLPDALPSYLRTLQRSYDHWEVETVFTEVARSLPLASPYEQALATTLVHDTALDVWRARAAAGDEAARAILDGALAHLGRARGESAAAASPAPPGYPELASASEALPRVEDHSPAELPAFIQAVRVAGSYGDEHLAAWTRHWIEREPEALLDALDRHTRAHGVPLETSTFREVIQLALARTGRQGAWRWLVEYHIALLGWVDGMYPLQDVQWIWDVIKTRFRDRWREFIQKTSRPRWRRSGGAPSWSIERMILFLQTLGEPEEARAVLDEATRWIRELAAEMHLPGHGVERAPEEDPPALGLLVDRLDCPSRLVQERASWALAGLLCDPETRGPTSRVLGQWHALDPSEMRTCWFLLILWLARVRGPITDQDCRTIADAISPRPSFGERMIFLQLGPLAAARASTGPLPASGAPPLDFAGIPEFEQVVSEHLAPIFLRWAAALDQRGIDFRRQWTYEAACLTAANGLRLGERSYLEHFHHRGSDDAGFLEINDRVALVLRSAYLRALHLFLDAGTIGQDEATAHALRVALLMDPLSWITQPAPRPSWWPAVSEAPFELQRVIGIVERALTARLGGPMTRGEPVVMYASGPVVTTPSLHVRLVVRGFLQSALGDRKPSADEVSAIPEIACRIDPSELAPVRSYVGIDPYIGPVGEWLFAPLAWRLDTDVIPWLSPHLLLASATVPARWLFAGPPEIRAEPHLVSIADAHGHVVERRFWNHELRGRSHRGEGSHAGFELSCPRDLLRPHLDADAELCWVAELEVSSRPRHGEAFEAPRVVMRRLLGGSRMVWGAPWLGPPEV